MRLNNFIGAAASLAAAILAPPPAAASECDAPRSDWLMCEDFEDGGLGWEAWFEQSPFTECNGCPDGVADPARIRLVDDESRDGTWSLHMPAEASAGFRGASLTYRSCATDKRAGCALTGYDELYYRAWVKLADDHQYVHHFMSIAGTKPDNYWDSDGNAGCRPNGERAAGTTVDFNRDHELFFYTYFPGMNCDSGGYCSGSYAQNICDGCATKDMPCTDSLECCWGNSFTADPPPVLPRGRWVCLEMMQRLNTPGQADGEMAFWVDGELGHRQTGMQWRDIAELQLNKVWVQHYIDNGDADQPNRIWWDDIVVSTSPIGCEPGTAPPTNNGTNNGPGPASNNVTSNPTNSGTGGNSTGEPLVDGNNDGAPTGSNGGGTDSPADVNDAGGCGCSASSAPGSPFALVLIAWLGARRRRRVLDRLGWTGDKN